MFQAEGWHRHRHSMRLEPSQSEGQEEVQSEGECGTRNRRGCTASGTGGFGEESRGDSKGNGKLQS